jgi:hypothetical protein
MRAAMEQQIRRVRKIVARWRGRQTIKNADVQDFERSTSPDARMNLLLRFSTDAGPRTIIASGIPLRIASDIAREMARAGHFAEFVDQFPVLSMADRIRRQKSEKQSATKQRKIVALSATRALA